MPKKPLALLILLTLILCTALPLPCRAQPLRAYALPTQPQLPVAQVHAVAQTQDRMMWYATTDGLCRDNGYQVDVFRPGRNDHGVMGSSNILSLATAKDRVVFGTDEGLYVLGLHDMRIARVAFDGDTKEPVRVVFVAADGSVWATMGRTTLHFTPQLRLAASYKNAQGVSAFFKDNRKRMWQLSQQGPCVLSSDGKRFVSLPWTGASPVAISQSGEKDKYWIATYGDGIVLYDERTGIIVPQEGSRGAAVSDHRIIDMCLDPQTELLWVSTMSGLDVYKTSGGRLEKVDVVGNLPRRKLIVDRLCRDLDGNMWVSGFSPSTFIVAPDAGSVRRLEVGTMSQATGFGLLADRMVRADGDYYWIWQGRYGLALYHEPDGMLNFINDSRPQGVWFVERNIIKDGATGLLAYSDHTVWRLRHEGMTIETEKVVTLPEGRICGLNSDSQGRLWIATRRSIHLFWPVSGMLRELYQGEVSLLGGLQTDGRACLFARGRQLYGVTADGKSALMSDVGEDITCIATHNDGTAWIASRQGHVARVKNGKAEIIPSLSESQGHTIKQIAFDGSGCLWTLTDQKVTRHNLQTKGSVSYHAGDPEIAVDYFYRLEPEAQGMGVAGAGAYCVLPATAMSQMPADKVTPMVTSVATHDTLMLIGMGERSVEIPADASSVSLCFATGEHLHADKVSFAWRIGVDGEWRVLSQGDNRAYLGDLARGTYNIYVKATDRFGTWGEPSLALTLHRLPTWYESWWAWTVYVLIAISMAVGLAWLANRIWYLRRLQAIRREMSLDTVSLEPNDVSAHRYDAAFTRSMIEAVEDHLSDPSYNVQRLADDLHTSRANLFRRCKTLTGKNPTGLIREIRLKAAASMLVSSPEASIADIAVKTGFASSSYFTKCFKEMFGVLPTDYRTGG